MSGSTPEAESLCVSRMKEHWRCEILSNQNRPDITSVELNYLPVCLIGEEKLREASYE